MRSFQIGSLQLINNSQAAPGFIPQTFTGLDSPDYRTNEYARPGQDGAIISSMFYDARTVTVEGQLYGTSGLEYESYRQALIAACAINKDSNNYPTPTRVTFTTMGGTSYFFDAIIGRPIIEMQKPLLSDFHLTMTVTNPFIFGNTAFTSPNIAPATGGGFILPVVLPIVSSAAVGGVVTVTNVGQATTLPTITLTGLLTQPALYNQTTGKSMQLSYTINSGDTVVIDMYNKTITLNGSSSLLSTKTSSSDWWGVQPGANQISISTISSGDTGYAVVSGNPSFIGV